MNTSQLVLFKLNEEEYGIEITYVQEIIRIPKITKIPNTPDYVRGIMNLRDKAIIVIDLKEKFGFSKLQESDDCRLIVLNKNKKVISIIVDDVSEVIHLDDRYIEAPPSVITEAASNCLKGIGRIDEKLLLLLDGEKIFNDSIALQN